MDAGSTVRVLLVDDQQPFRSAARLVIELTDGFEVVGEAADGEEALRLVGELDPDLVLMDIKMPGIDGLEATRRIVAGGSAARVVVVSTHDDYRGRAVEAGAVAFMPKSDFSADEIVAVWNEAS